MYSQAWNSRSTLGSVKCVCFLSSPFGFFCTSKCDWAYVSVFPIAFPMCRKCVWYSRSISCHAVPCRLPQTNTHPVCARWKNIYRNYKKHFLLTHVWHARIFISVLSGKSSPSSESEKRIQFLLMFDRLFLTDQKARSKIVRVPCLFVRIHYQHTRP